MVMLVAVYGTLKRGLANHHYVRDLEYMGEAVTAESKYFMADYEGEGEKFPMATYVPNGELTNTDKGRIKILRGNRIGCEIFKIGTDQKKVLRDMDELEGHPDFYIRTIQTFKWEKPASSSLKSRLSASMSKPFDASIYLLPARSFYGYLNRGHEMTKLKGRVYRWKP